MALLCLVLIIPISVAAGCGGGNNTSGTQSLAQLGEGGVASWVACKLADGAVSYVGGQLFGWGLSELGLGFPDKTAEELNEIKSAAHPDAATDERHGAEAGPAIRAA